MSSSVFLCQHLKLDHALSQALIFWLLWNTNRQVYVQRHANGRGQLKTIVRNFRCRLYSFMQGNYFTYIQLVNKLKKYLLYL